MDGTAGWLERVFVGVDHPVYRAAPEIVLRAAAMYAFAHVILRVAGKRFVGELTPVEKALSFGIGTAIGVPALFLGQPLTHGMVVVATFVALQWAITRVSYRRPALQRLIHGKPTRIVRDGELVMSTLREVRLGSEELFAQLRARGVTNLGQVDAAYLERSGALTIIKAPQAAPGLRIAPPPGYAPSSVWTQEEAEELLACRVCGHTQDEDEACEACGADRFTVARCA